MSPFSGNTYSTTPNGFSGSEFRRTTSSPFISRETPENRFTGITSSPYKSRDSSGVRTSAITSSIQNTYSTPQPSSNSNFNYQTPATSFSPNQDYGNYQPGPNINTIPDRGSNYGSNDQFVNVFSTPQPSGFNTENNENIGSGSPGGQMGLQGHNNANLGAISGFGTNPGYSSNASPSNPSGGNEIPAGIYNQRPGTSSIGSYNQNSGTASGPSNNHNKNPGPPNTTGSNVANIGNSASNDQYNENLIPQGTQSFGSGSIGGYESNTYGGSSEIQRPNSFNTGNNEVSGSNHADSGNLGIQGPNNFNNGGSSIDEPNTGYSGDSGLISSNIGGVDNFGSNNVNNGLPGNYNSSNVSAANLGNSEPSNGYGNNFGPQETSNAYLGNSAINQQELNNAIEGSSGSQSPSYASVGNQAFQNPNNALLGSNNMFDGSGALQGFGGANTGSIEPNFSTALRPQRPEENNSNQNGDYSAIPGTPDINYPILSEIPATKFSCKSQKYPGYYADIEARCQVFHICANGLKYDFLCPNGTIFHQRYFVCVWWNQFECNTAESLYSSNENLYDYDKMGSLIANVAEATGAQGPSITREPGFNPQASTTIFNPSPGPSGSPADFTPSSGFQQPYINYSTHSQEQGVSPDSGVSTGQQGSLTSTIPSSPGYEEPSTNYGSSNIGSTVAPQKPISGFGSTDRPQSSSGSFDNPSGYSKPFNTYNFQSQPQTQSSNFGSSVNPPGQSIDYGASNGPQGTLNGYRQSLGPGEISPDRSPSNSPAASAVFASSPDLQGFAASYPGYQEKKPSAGDGSFSTPQSTSVTHSLYSIPQNSVVNFKSSTQPQDTTNTSGPQSSLQEFVNYEPSYGSQHFPNNLGTPNSPPSLSNNFRPSAGSQGPGTYFKPTSTSQNGYEISGSMPESVNIGQTEEPQSFTSTNSPLTSIQGSTAGYDLPSALQTFSGNVYPSSGISTSSDNFPQSSGIQKQSSNYGSPTNSQKPSSSNKYPSSPSPNYQSLSEPQSQLPNVDSSYNYPEASSGFILPASSSGSISNYSPSSIPQGNSIGLGQQPSLQRPSPSYGPPSGPLSNFGPQWQTSDTSSNVNPQGLILGYSSTPNPIGESSFRPASTSQITSASFSPLSSRPSSNYGAPPYSTANLEIGSNFGGAQGSSPTPFTLAGASRRPSPIYSPPASSESSTPGPQPNYNPSQVNRQQADFSISTPKFIASSNNEQGVNYQTTVGPNRLFNTGITEQPSNYSPSDFSTTAITSPVDFGSQFFSLSTPQPESYSTELNVPSNTFSVQESSYPGYDTDTTQNNNAPFVSSNQQVTKPDRQYLPPFRKRR